MSSTKNSNPCSAVVDNNILMDLYELGRLDLLFLVFDVVSIPRMIYDSEILPDIRTTLDIYLFQLSDLENEVGFSTFHMLTNAYAYRNLSVQDKVAISIAKQYTFYCNSNDALVRKACLELNVQYLGILGVLELAYNTQKISFDELTAYCRLLESDKTSCFISSKVIDDFIERLTL